MPKPKIICVVGPTASGKTGYAISLAKKMNGEVVSCDSMQIYQQMTIGTAKPTKEEMQGIPHHMMDIVSPNLVPQPYRILSIIGILSLINGMHFN